MERAAVDIQTGGELTTPNVLAAILIELRKMNANLEKLTEAVEALDETVEMSGS